MTRAVQYCRRRRRRAPTGINQREQAVLSLIDAAKVCRYHAAALACALAVGCGTTKWSDTSRTATEQLLISDAVDRAVSEIDFGVLAGKDVFLDAKYIGGAVDEKYIVGTMRQHMLASGCIVKESIEDANYVVEVRSGAVGTNRNELLFGVPQTSLPTGGMFPVAPTSIPELPLMKRTNQAGVCKIAVFAYDRKSGHPVWQSGTRQVASNAKDIWVFGTGPFQSGTIYDGRVKFAGEKLKVPLQDEVKLAKQKTDVSVAQELLFAPTPATSPQAAPRALAADSGTSTQQKSPDSVAPRDPSRNARAGYVEPVPQSARLPYPPGLMPR